MVLDRFASFVCDTDPDLLTSFEMQRTSLGYLSDRHYELSKHDIGGGVATGMTRSYGDCLSRILPISGKQPLRQADEWGMKQSCHCTINKVQINRLFCV